MVLRSPQIDLVKLIHPGFSEQRIPQFSVAVLLTKEESIRMFRVTGGRTISTADPNPSVGLKPLFPIRINQLKRTGDLRFLPCSRGLEYSPVSELNHESSGATIDMVGMDFNAGTI